MRGNDKSKKGPAARRAEETQVDASDDSAAVLPSAAGVGDGELVASTAVSDTETDTNSADPFAEFFVSNEECELITRSFSAAGVGTSVAAHGTLELLAFWVANEEYAIPIVGVQEIIKVPTITELPRANRNVLGIISLRGTIVPVLDLRRVLDLEETPLSRPSRILVVRSEEDLIGLLVDRVTSVVRFEDGKVEPTPRAIRRQTSDYVRGVGRIGSRLIIVLDINAVLVTMDVAA